MTTPGARPTGGRGEHGPVRDHQDCNAFDRQRELEFRHPARDDRPRGDRHLQALRATGRFTYDPGFTSTAGCESTITFIDGDEGVLLYRGYPIDELAEHGDFLEICYLLLYGELPTAAQEKDFDHRVTRHTMVHEQMARFYQGFRRDAHPMAVMCGVVGAMSAFYHDSHRHPRSLPARWSRRSG